MTGDGRGLVRLVRRLLRGGGGEDHRRVREVLVEADRRLADYEIRLRRLELGAAARRAIARRADDA